MEYSPISIACVLWFGNFYLNWMISSCAGLWLFRALWAKWVPAAIYVAGKQILHRAKKRLSSPWCQAQITVFFLLFVIFLYLPYPYEWLWWQQTEQANYRIQCKQCWCSLQGDKLRWLIRKRSDKAETFAFRVSVHCLLNQCAIIN